MENIKKIAKKLRISASDLTFYGKNVAKVENSCGKKNGKLVLVTAMTSNKSGIGKTTVSIGLADAFSRLHRNVCLALREPSLGPVFGIKGGATGGGKSSLFPSDEINLHFTGDFHAVTSANNLLCAIVDNHIFQGNELNIDTKSVCVSRCIDCNDRSLRDFSYSIRDERLSGRFVITPACEVMAILSLCKDMEDLKEKLGNILVAKNYSGKPIFARDFHAEGAMAILLKEAIKPNLVQTLAGTPALVHLGPFANIAHGCNSLIATKFALSHADICVTEAGFGTDLGGEKFVDIKSRQLEKSPDAVVLVVTLSAVKEHGGGDINIGFENVKKHIENVQKVFCLPLVVAINRHATDDEKELEKLQSLCVLHAKTVTCDPFCSGGEGCVDLAKNVLQLFDEKGRGDFAYDAEDDKDRKVFYANTEPKFAYDLDEPIEIKIEKVAKRVYGAKSVKFSAVAKEKIEFAKTCNFAHFFVNIAKTQFSFTDKKESLGAPKDFEFCVTDIEIRSGANMIVAIAGDMMLLPGLSKHPNFEKMDIDKNGEISGLF